MRRSGLAAALYVALVFLSGVLVGAFGYRLYMVNTVLSVNQSPPSPEDFRRKYTDEMRQRLSLTPDQVGKLQVILDETRQRFRDLHERSRPEMKAIQDEQVQKINALLNDQQRVEYEKYREEREHRRQQGHKRPDR